MLIEKEVSELKVGHFVVKIIQQKGHFALTSAGHIKSKAVINHLKSKNIYRVLIDDSKTLVPKNIDSDENSIMNNKDLEHAKAIIDQSKSIQKKLFEDALKGNCINLSPVVNIVNKSIDAIFNSPDSLSCMLNIREKDEYLFEHSVAVSIYITIFSRYLDLKRDIIEQLSIGAFLHDIGKIKIPDAILNKPGKLTDDEFTIMKTHANHSISIIKDTSGISELSLEVAALHHEKLDGNGYPFQVKADAITLYGRMISICDIFDALTATRVYKKGFAHNKAFAILRELGKKNQLDANLVDHFIRCVGVFPIGSLVQLESNKLALVKARNDKDPTNPHVQSFYHVEQHQFINKQEINLAKSQDSIVKGVSAEEFNLDMGKIVEMILMEG
ncbi:HD-GYP domain-containing protein [Colwellia psychrerythraea]|uniref:Metal dependent phosphohydrolase n=1 Tax=Colwellia psychrerythraea TaxID=28229 RepID=A0A099KWU5_COLPS|nr:HD-GYP domain-containing protein [Colwellia psychrerythraea]KGJ94357.1 metal dependent phosphohydrolase [Colwellia psychrerythraea]